MEEKICENHKYFCVFFFHFLKNKIRQVAEFRHQKKKIQIVSANSVGGNLVEFFQIMFKKHENFVISMDVLAIFRNKKIKLATSRSGHFIDVQQHF
jgi:hypothetical protein